MFGEDSLRIFVEQKLIDMKNIICVDLTILSIDQLKDFCAEYNLSYGAILEFKQNTYAKLWITKDGKCLSFTLTKDNDFGIEDYDTVRVFKGFLAELSAMPVYQVPVVPVILDVDTILDKILKYGKGSLTLEEKSFLDNQ